MSKTKKNIKKFQLKIFIFHNFKNLFILHGHVFVMGDTAGLKCRELTSDESWHCRGRVGVFFFRQYNSTLNSNYIVVF